MIIARAPLRVSLFGGGTDFPAHYHEHGGFCLATTIDKYVYVVVKRRHDESIRVAYTQTETVDDIDDLHHDLIREALRMTGVTSGVEVVTLADVPGHGSGLASSSAVTVAALAALLPGIDTAAELAIKIECDVLGHTPGHQDQITVAKGGLVSIEFGPNVPDVTRLAASPYAPFIPEFNRNFLLFKIPHHATRDGRHILAHQNKRVGTNTNALSDLKVIAQLAAETIARGDFSRWGDWLHCSWEIKKSLAPGITSDVIDAMYNAARNAGATGGKVCGAGGGGYLLLYCPGDAPQRVREVLAGCDELQFEYESEGVKCKRLF